jgi:hypothetical protein
LCELRVERIFLTRILGELYELHEFFISDYLFYVKYHNVLSLFLKIIRTIRTIRLKFVLNGAKNVFLTLNSRKFIDLVKKILQRRLNL